MEESENIEVRGAREHNLKNIHVDIPRNDLTVLTGLSGSGKSSLAFDTIYAEGQRRYIETYSSYVRSFLGGLERPDVDKINGLSPVISIEQKTISKNPRSTVGTITEVYDFMRLLFARAGEAFSYNTGERMVQYSDDQIIDLIQKDFNGKKTVILAPVVKGRKGHYRELFEQIIRYGFLRARVDGQILEVTEPLRLDRYKVHDVEIVIDRLEVKEKDEDRLRRACRTALKYGSGTMMILDHQSGEVRHFSRNLMCPTTGLSYDEPAPNLFSFNSPYGACPECNGLGLVTHVDRNKIIPDPSKSIKNGGLGPLGKPGNNWVSKQIEALLEKYGYALNDPLSALPEDLINKILYGADEHLKVHSSVGIDEFTVKYEGLINFISRQYEENPSKAVKKWSQSFMNKDTCPKCEGARLKKEALYFRMDGKNIAELATKDIQELGDWFQDLESRLTEKQNRIARDVLKEIRARIRFLLDVGLTYLTLDRPAKTLSGGEAQRIRLATQIGSQLVDVLYILDEPSIGLHQRDNARLIASLKELRDLGNSVIVVEHDKDMILSADHVVDLGPTAGVHGGHVVAEGTPKGLEHSDSLTSQYLFGDKEIQIPQQRRKGNGKELTIKGASGHNLKEVDVRFPLGKFICVTGVSGSGKSSLIDQTLYPALSNHYFNSEKQVLPYDKMEGLKHVDKVIDIDQTPIGRTPRSNPATYTGVFSDIRSLFAQTPEAKIRGYQPGRFSFNVKGGRCETCKGGGLKTIEMNFLPDVHVTCEDCNGKRYNRETLEVRYKGKSISDVLEMTIERATAFFEDLPRIARRLKTLEEVGLGYLKLGQASTTISGGEAQRVKLATELAKKDTGNTFYILDEPTTGLHFEDIRMLIDVLNRLVDHGNTVLVIEHNLDVIKVADHILDLGPEGGDSGGILLFSGTPEGLAQHPDNHTGGFLKRELESGKPVPDQ